MKQFGLLFFFLAFSVFACAADDARLTAVEDFSRFDPGEYNKGEWKIIAENGKNILQAQKGSNILAGWQFVDFRGNNYILRLRFRLHERNTTLKYTFHGTGEDAAFPYMYYFFTLAHNKAFLSLRPLTKKDQNPIPLPEAVSFSPEMEENVWYELEFRVKSDSLDSILIQPDGKETQLIKAPLNPGSRAYKLLQFSGTADVEWIKSFPIMKEK